MKINKKKKKKFTANNFIERDRDLLGLESLF